MTLAERNLELQTKIAEHPSVAEASARWEFRRDVEDDIAGILDACEAFKIVVDETEHDSSLTLSAAQAIADYVLGKKSC